MTEKDGRKEGKGKEISEEKKKKVIPWRRQKMWIFSITGICTTPTHTVCVLYPRKAHNTNCLLARIAGGLKRYENHPPGGGMKEGGREGRGELEHQGSLFVCLSVCLCRVYTAAAAAVTQRGQHLPTGTTSAGPNCISGGGGGYFPHFHAPHPPTPSQNKRDPFHPLSTFRSLDSLP